MMAVAPCRRKSLRNSAINYRSGWWSVSVQVAKNKSILGAIVGERVSLNVLGRAVEGYWRDLPAKYPELELFDFVVMPNHFHALLRIHFAPTNREQHLGFLMSRFKGGTSFIYGKMRRAGEVEREALRRSLAKKRPLIAVSPAGIPGRGEMAGELAAAIDAGWALAVSPQPPGSRLNKKIATWCNEFLLKNADEIWVGDLSPNGMLVQMLRGLGRLKPTTSIETAGKLIEKPTTSIETAGKLIEKPATSIETAGKLIEKPASSIGNAAKQPLSKGAALAAPPMKGVL